MKDYFSHDYNSRNDKKLVKAGMKFDLCTAIGAYWCIVEMLYEDGGYLLLSEYERITYELRCSNELVTYLIHESDLFVNDGERFWSETAIERLKLRASKSQKARESIENRWNKHRNTNVLQTNNDRNTSKVKESKVNNKYIEGEKEEKKTVKKVFTPPSIEDVKKYCLERGNGVSAERFINHYTSNGWMVGKNKMKDWRAAVRTWEQNTKKYGTENAKNKTGGGYTADSEAFCGVNR